MNIISDFEAHRRDEEFDRKRDRVSAQPSTNADATVPEAPITKPSGPQRYTCPECPEVRDTEGQMIEHLKVMHSVIVILARHFTDAEHAKFSGQIEGDLQRRSQCFDVDTEEDGACD